MSGPKPRSYTAKDKAGFLAALERLGTVTAAAKELGFPRHTCYAWSRAAGKGSGRTKQKYTQERKDEFFTVLDRAGSVSAAARELGLNVNTAFQWAYKTGAVTVRSRPGGTKQAIAQARKDEFFALLDRVDSVTAAANQLGLNPKTCFGWTSKLGMTKPRLIPGRKEEFLRRRARGLSLREAVSSVGVSMTTGRRWDHGTVRRNGKDVYPDTPPVPYNLQVTSTFTESSGVRAVPAPVTPLTVVEREISARYLSVAERETIADLRSKGRSIRAIARELGRCPGTVSREIARNSHPELGYMPHGAQRAAAGRRARPKPSKLAEPGPLREYVVANLGEDWSPEQISYLLIKDFPDDPLMRVSHETIYQALYFQARGGLKREIQAALRSGRTRRKPHRNPEERTHRFRDPMVNISERPAEIEDRAVPGHWEGDLVRHEAL